MLLVKRSISTFSTKLSSFNSYPVYEYTKRSSEFIPWNTHLFGGGVFIHSGNDFETKTKFNRACNAVQKRLSKYCPSDVTGHGMPKDALRMCHETFLIHRNKRELSFCHWHVCVTVKGKVVPVLN
jgi:hypothetical protein